MVSAILQSIMYINNDPVPWCINALAEYDQSISFIAWIAPLITMGWLAYG